jgi:hypothetical protein
LTHEDWNQEYHLSSTVINDRSHLLGMAAFPPISYMHRIAVEGKALGLISEFFKWDAFRAEAEGVQE